MTGTLTAAVPAEWMKLRTVRGPYLAVCGAALAVAIGSLVVLAVVGAYDAAAPQQRAGFEAADPTVVVMPFVAFFLGCLGALAVTPEHTSGSIDSSLVAVPRRGALLAAKATVVAAVTLVEGLAFAAVSFLLAWTILDGRPAPINPWPSAFEAVPSVLAAGGMVMVAGLVALGLGTALRSTTATVVALAGLQLVMPIFAHFVPEPWGERIASVLLPNLAPQLAGAPSAYVLTPLGALLVTAAYLAVAFVAAVLTSSRDV